MIVQELGFRYPRRSVFTIDYVNLDIRKNHITGLFGPNGSGKTTLLKCMVGLLKNTKGSIKVNDVEVSQMEAVERATNFAYVPQELELNMPFTVFDVVAMGRNYCQKSMYLTKEDEELTSSVLEKLNIEHLKNEFFTELSGGQRQLVSIARAVNQQSDYLFLDEPVSNLDYSNAHMIWKNLRKLKEERKTIVVSSHDPNHILRYCDEVVLMTGGKIIDKGSPREVITEKNLQLLFNIPVKIGNIGDDIIVIPHDH